MTDRLVLFLGSLDDNSALKLTTIGCMCVELDHSLVLCVSNLANLRHMCAELAQAWAYVCRT